MRQTEQAAAAARRSSDELPAQMGALGPVTAAGRGRCVVVHRRRPRPAHRCGGRRARSDRRRAGNVGGGQPRHGHVGSGTKRMRPGCRSRPCTDGTVTDGRRQSPSSESDRCLSQTRKDGSVGRARSTRRSSPRLQIGSRPSAGTSIAFANRTDIDPVTQAAVAHAQFEMIHPYADGNGRIGRRAHRVVADAGDSVS